MPIILSMKSWLCLIIEGFEICGDGSMEMAGSPALLFCGVGVGLVVRVDVAQHGGRKIYYKLTSAD